MGSDPGSDLPDLPQQKDIPNKDHLEHKKPDRDVRCTLCGLVARNNGELRDHVKHAHEHKDPCNTSDVYSEEQKIDPFVKRKD